MAYIGWALVWGALPCWQWLWRRRSIFAFARRVQAIGWALHLALVFTWMLYGVLIGSSFGAGIYQFLRYRRSRTTEGLSSGKP